jgi:hypothetical protein
MPRGGARRNAGRKPGSRNIRTERLLAAVEGSGITPLAYFLKQLRNENLEPAIRMKAAEAAAPYVHPKLAAVEHTGEGGGPIALTVSQSDADL